MNKKLMIPLFAVFALGLVVAAGFIVSTLTLTVGVAEPFEVQYAMLGDAGDYGGTPTCADNTVWFNAGDTSIPTGPMFPEESRKLCVKIGNEGESPITYSVTSKITNTNTALRDKCALAFPETTLYGVVPGSSIITNGQAFTVPGNAPVVSGCLVTVEVARGVEGPVQGTAYFTQKDTTTWIPYGTTASVTYTRIGDTFDVSGIPSTHTLVYYPDMTDFATNVANVIVLHNGVNNIQSLPIVGDVGDSYCTNGFNPDAKVCNGAKLWLIPGDSLSLENAKAFLTNWNTNAPSIWFETDLITYAKTA